MFKKGIPDLLLNFVHLYTKDYSILNSFCFYCIFSVRKSDHKTFLWTKGVVTSLLEKLSLLTSQIPDKKEEEIKEETKIDKALSTSIENILLTLSILARDCCKYF